MAMIAMIMMTMIMITKMIGLMIIIKTLIK